MAEMTIIARVRRDGTLKIPRKVRESLGLQEGDQVEITVSRPERDAETTESDPLLDLIGIGKGGPPNGAQNHDETLYRRSPS